MSGVFVAFVMNGSTNATLECVDMCSLAGAPAPPAVPAAIERATVIIPVEWMFLAVAIVASVPVVAWAVRRVRFRLWLEK